MVKTILLKIDDNFFYKMSMDKLERENKLRKKITWEDYIKLLFGFEK